MNERAFYSLVAGWLAVSTSYSADIPALKPTPQPHVPMAVVSGGWKSSWSQDGQRLVYGIGDGQGLEVFDLRTLDRTRIRSRGKDPAWSPDGRWIAFVHEEVHNEIRNEEVWLIQPDGTGERRLGIGGYPSWATGGKSVHALRRDNWQFVELDVATGESKDLAEFRESYYPALSPDGKLIAFGAEQSLKVIERGTGKLLHRIPATQDRGLLPAWSPDGKFVGFGGYDADSSGVRVLEVATGKHAMIWPGPFTMPAWTPDGSRMAFDLRSFGERAVWQVGRRWIEGRLSGEVPLPELDATEKPDAPEPTEPADTMALVGQPAPNFKLTTLTGDSVELAKLKGRPVVLDFWATWCPPCRRGLPHLNEIAQREAKNTNGALIFAVNVREARPVVSKYIKDNSLTFTVPLDPEGEVSESYQVQGIPTTVVIDREGQIRDALIGFGPDSGKALDAAIERVSK